MLQNTQNSPWYFYLRHRLYPCTCTMFIQIFEAPNDKGSIVEGFAYLDPSDLAKGFTEIFSYCISQQ